MISLSHLINYLDQLLNPAAISDYCPNGLQVEGKSTIKKVVTGVTANQALLDAAVARNADAILVHHGYFWKGEDACIRSVKKNRLRTLLQHDVSLLTYHLPLDVHLDYGNNAQLAKMLNLQIDRTLPVDGINNLFFLGQLKQELTTDAFIKNIRHQLQRQPLHIPGAAKIIRTIAWCTGAAQHYFKIAVQEGVDAYLTGEISESTVHLARETGVHFFAAGHHATERYGVKAVGEHLQDVLGIECEFVDVESPV